jgi:hypothetical protein
MEPIMTTHRSMYLLAVVALAGTGCSSDNSSPTGPEAVQAVVTDGQTAGKASRTPYISDLQLHSIYVDMGPDGTYDNGWDIVLTNPSSKATGLFLQSEIRQNQYTVDAGGTIIFCPALDGVLAHGTCRMQWTITPPPVYLALAPAQFTVRLMQRRADNSLVVLDSRTFDVVIVHS